MVVGASAGGVDALSTFVTALPADLQVAVAIVLHVAPRSPSVLPQILARRTPLTVRHAGDGDALLAGEILVAPPDRHLLIRRDEVRLVRGPQENGHRPAVNALFRSAARWWGECAVGVVLTGALDDGSAGLRSIADRGGLALVQNPDEATVSTMPRRALDAVPDAECHGLLQLATRVGALEGECAHSTVDDVDDGLWEETELEQRGARGDWVDLAPTAAGLTCPDCGGSLFELHDAQVDRLRFRCRVGHAWTPDALAAKHITDTEDALWIALRIIEDDIALQRRLEARALEGGRALATERIQARIRERRKLLDRLRDMIDTTPVPEIEGG